MDYTAHSRAVDTTLASTARSAIYKSMKGQIPVANATIIIFMVVVHDSVGDTMGWYDLLM